MVFSGSGINSSCKEEFPIFVLSSPRGIWTIEERVHDYGRISWFPGVIGAIDCVHIEIASPGGEKAELFRNRKGYFSLNVQCVCTANRKIINIVASWPGGVHDSRIFENSKLKQNLERAGGDVTNLGDSGYTCLPYLMTPLNNPSSRPERRYNTAQKTSRCVIERMFGTWKKRFPCLLYLNRGHVDKLMTLIVATAVLHNIALQQKDPDFEPVEEEIAAWRDWHLPDVAPQMTGDSRETAGNARRRALIENFFS